MNWVDLLNALPVAGCVLPLLLAICRLIPLTACVTIQTTALTAMTAWSFLRGSTAYTVCYACLTVCSVLLLRRCLDHRRSEARRRDQEHAHVTGRAPGPDRTASTDRDRGTEPVYVITTVNKP
ncbi:hypothetical protein [Streptomyces noursei]|uniref:hypothetical protein n=1 Tax=Streptomyces noursei TaxID=1971 RepID=UPI0038071395